MVDSQVCRHFWQGIEIKVFNQFIFNLLFDCLLSFKLPQFALSFANYILFVCICTFMSWSIKIIILFRLWSSSGLPSTCSIWSSAGCLTGGRFHPFRVPFFLRLDCWRCRRCCRFLLASKNCWVSWDPTSWRWSMPSTSTTKSSIRSWGDLTATSTRTCLSGLVTRRSTPLRSVTWRAFILKDDANLWNSKWLCQS